MTEACGITDTGCIRSNNEDCYRIVPEFGLYLLVEGMGGARAGEKASDRRDRARGSLAFIGTLREPLTLLPVLNRCDRGEL